MRLVLLVSGMDRAVSKLVCKVGKYCHLFYSRSKIHLNVCSFVGEAVGWLKMELNVLPEISGGL